MDSIFLLVPIVILFIAGAVKLFFWAVNSGQYDDLETEGRRILFDDDAPRTSGKDIPAQGGDTESAPSPQDPSREQN
ncbi:cbb3-type cytochrome oxidase assembly protein CcoS [Microbulbifer sp.]|uniref:cbb3-type cytochrome oxidase assembly protein CcoS n=1 Tax=Microbulbifer sp. TaxID=1908541 RepID=UPI002F94FDC2